MKVSNMILKVVKLRCNKVIFILISEYNFCFLRFFFIKCCCSVFCRNSCRFRVVYFFVNGLIFKG